MTRMDIEELKRLVEQTWAVGFTPKERREHVQMWRREDREEARERMRELFDKRFSNDYENKHEAREAFVEKFEQLLKENA